MALDMIYMLITLLMIIGKGEDNDYVRLDGKFPLPQLCN